MAARAGYAVPAKRVRVSLGPFVGLRDRRPASAEGAASEGAFYAYGENVWVRDPATPGGVELRPAMSVLAVTPGSRQAQGFLEHIDTTATRRLFQAAGGKLYRFAAPAWVDVSPAATLDASARFVYLTSFNGKLIVSDGVNKPFAATALGTTPVTSTVVNVDSVPSSWAAYGPPVVYGGKLFFIRANDRTRLVWSEEADEATGYEQTGYANYWSLTQTDAAPLTALAATNDALYFFRPGSIGAVYGEVSSDFSSTATRDAVSTVHGTIAPASVKVIGTEVWFLDRSGFPAVIVPGGGVRRLDGDAIEAIIGLASSTYPASQAGAWTEYDPARGLVYMAVPTTQSTTMDRLLVFHAATKACMGVWTLPGGAQVRAGGSYYQGTNYDETRVVVGDTAGNVWQVASPISASGGQDTSALGVTTPISAVLVTEPVAGNPSTEVRWDLIAAALRIPTDNSSLARSFTIAYRVPRATYGTAQAATATAAYDGGSARAVVGVLAQGRSIQVRIATSATSPGRFVLDAIALEGAALPPNAVAY